ncbi:hypothetical protein C900_03928 [Fulvivirga imtechensis AK7]|uniref:Fibronectin type-III domain-containing protein n=1 Tax=Fulvivirga imtechensis AK7 TaxID=1237149 RepID=L8JPZ3_9BACT|nr:M4 family metallopeptidase [Fulvivirga imtechensis]ELR70243.1 hypothetical protein C900_03928 [Fulvivirga imtechensis AK7]
MKPTFMSKMFTHLLTLLLLASLNLAYAQDVSEYEEKGLFRHFRQFSEAPAFQSPESFVKEYYKANVDYGIKVLDVETDNLGITHYRLQQTLSNAVVANSMLILHVRDSKVISANGEWYRRLPASLKQSPAISEELALSKALQKVDAKTYIWQTEEAKEVKAGKRSNHRNINYDQPEGELVYITINNELDASKLTLAYRFDVFAVEPYTEQNVYVDAGSGEIIFEESLIHDALVNGTANTGYYGAKSITVDQSGGYYYARQTGNRNFQLYNNNSPYYSTSSTFSGTGNAKYYIDVYWGAEVTWDFLKEKFGRNGYDNAGSKINLVVNNPQVNNNAYWQNGTASFGNSSSGTPFTPLDVVGHEIAHGVTGTSARLIYQGESGALNEAFSDIFGTYAEHYANVGDKWTVGENISFQRSMSNPNRYRQPDTYKGTYWAPTNGGDNGGVHTNSGVLNYWYYLTAQGGSGTNDNGQSFSVSGVGIEKAAQIAYRALTRYLTSNSGYSAARTAVINAARDLYGNGSCEEAAATDAMRAVGVGSAFSGNCGNTTCAALTGLSASQISTTGATISWNGVSGVNSYTLEYKTAGSSTYTTLTVNGTSRTLTGLTPGTTYNVRARYTCSNGSVAEYATINFTTGSDNQNCNAVTGLSVSSVTQTSASVSWNGVSGVSSYTLEYKASSASSYTSQTVNGTSFGLTGLTAGTAYDVRVRYTCSNGQPSAYANTTFTTDTDGGGGCDGLPVWNHNAYYYAGDQVVYNNKIYEALYNIYYWPPTSAYWKEVGPCDGGGACSAVTGLVATQITSNSAQISWNAVDGVSSYRFGYKRSSGSTWTTETVSSNTEPFTGLAAGISYDVRINYTCSNGQTAPYATVTFTTESGDTGGCSGVPPYESGRVYSAGDRVVYQGYLYEAQISGIYWPPNYGWWTNLGPCTGGYSSFAAGDPSMSPDLEVYPNPALDHVNVKYMNRRRTRHGQVRIINGIGATVYHQDVDLQEGMNEIGVSLKSVQAGVYILEIDGEKRRLVVQQE